MSSEKSGISGTSDQAFWVDSLHIFTLNGFAVAQPLFDLLGKNATFFAAHQSSPGEIILWALALLVALPAGLVVIEALTRLISRRAQHHLHTVVVSLLGGLVVAPPIVRFLELEVPVALPVFIAASVLVGVIYRSTRVFGQVLRWGALAPAFFLGWFLVATPVSALVLDSTTQLEDLELGSDTPVVMVVLDELSLAGLLDSSGSLNKERFDGFRRLSEISTWYPNATTVHDQSRVAVTSILTGTLPPHNAVPVSSRFPRNVFTLLGGSHVLHVQEAVTHLCPAELCERDTEGTSGFDSLIRDSAVAYAHLVAPKDLAADLLPAIDNRWAGFVDTETGNQSGSESGSMTLDEVRNSTRDLLASRQEHVRWETFLARLERGGRGDFFYLHSLLPHSAWRYLPDGNIYENDFFGDLFVDGAGAVWRDNSIYTDQGRQRFLLQTQFVDLQLSTMLETLEQAGILDDSLLVVVADHGIAFDPGLPRRNLAQGANRAEILPVPLFVKYPGQTKGEVDNRSAQTIDLLPTIADVLEIDLDWTFDGESLLGGTTGRETASLVTANGVETIDFNPLDAATEESAAFEEVFGTGDETFDVYGIGQHRALVGTTIDGLVLTETNTSIAATVSEMDRLQNVDVRARSIPARIVGTLSNQPQVGELALGLNGRVVGVARAYFYPDRDVWRFSFMVPTSLLRTGCNEVSLYEIAADGTLLQIPIQNDFTC